MVEKERRRRLKKRVEDGCERRKRKHKQKRQAMPGIKVVLGGAQLGLWDIIQSMYNLGRCFLLVRGR